MAKLFRFIPLVLILATALALGAGHAAAAVGSETQVLGAADPFFADPFAQELAFDAMATSSSSGTEHFGPFASGSPDSGTCGNDWADDTFDRFFIVHDNKDGTFKFVEQFKNGSFLTNGGASPGSCDQSDGYGPGSVASGLVGTMHGYLDFTVTGTRTGASCNATTCGTTAGALATLFVVTGPVTTDAYFFHYAGYDGTNKMLVVHEWKNASCNRGGNHGDIATVSLPLAVSTPCV